MERKVVVGFRISFWGGVLIGIVSIISGLWLSSLTIITDGMFALIGALLTSISLYVLRFVQRKDFTNFPFGKEALLPLIIFFQYLIILLVCGINLINALDAIFHPAALESSPFGLFVAVIFLALTFGAYRAVFWASSSVAENPVLKIETEQWLYSVYFSIGVVVSFVLQNLLLQTSYAALAVYTDPIMTILITFSFVFMAVVEIKKAIREIMSGTPDKELRLAIAEVVAQELQRCEHNETVLRVGKVGEQVVIELDILIKAATEMDSIRRQDEVRERLHQRLQAVYPKDIWLTVVFIGNPKWA